MEQHGEPNNNQSFGNQTEGLFLFINIIPVKEGFSR